MTQPLSGYGRVTPHPDPSDHDPVAKAAVDFCKTSKTVTAGFLCDEPTTTSDACRRPTNDVGAFVCDDRRMAQAQASIWEGLKEAAKVFLSALIGRAK